MFRVVDRRMAATYSIVGTFLAVLPSLPVQANERRTNLLGGEERTTDDYDVNTFEHTVHFHRERAPPCIVPCLC